jgi:arylsulfatase
MENAFLNVKNRSHSITAELELPARGEGVILCQGGRFAGWSLYMKGGRLYYVHNWFGRERYVVGSPATLPAGEVTVKYVFTFDGGDPGSGGTGALFIGDEQVAEARIEHTIPFLTGDEVAEVGHDGGTPVTEEYAGRDEFNGTIRQVTVELL